MPAQESATVIVTEEIQILLSTLANVSIRLHEAYSYKKKSIVLTSTMHAKIIKLRDTICQAI